MKRVVLLGMAVALLAPPAAASADGFQARFRKAVAVARQHFHAAPPCGHVSVSWARLGQPSGTGYFSVSHLAAANYEHCAIMFNADAYESAYTPIDAYDWAGFCTVVVHEYGHLVLGPDAFGPGQEHSPDSRNVMYAAPSPLRECRLSLRHHEIAGRRKVTSADVVYRRVDHYTRR